MARQVLLGDLNLMNRTTYRVRTAGPQFSEDASGVGSLTCVVPMLLLASTPASLWAARREIERVLKQAREAARDRLTASQRVSLSIQDDDEGWTYADVRGGTIPPDSWELFPDGRHAYCTIVLSCLPLLRTDAVQAQNLLDWPCDPTQTAWTKTNVTATSNDATAPDSSETAATLRETTATGTHGLQQSVTKAAESQALTASVYVLADGRDRVRLSLMSGVNGARATYRLDTGVVSTAAATTGSGWSGASASIVAVAGGWYRVSLTATSDTTTTATLVIDLDNGSGTSYAGNASLGALLWGAQIEQGSTAGLLLVPEMLPDTVTGERIIPGDVIPDAAETYADDPDDLLTSTWTVSQSTETLSQADPAGGTQARRFVANTNANVHYVRTSQATVSAGANTAAIYLKKYGSSSGIVRVLFSGLNDSTGYVVSVDLDNGTVTSPTLVGGSGYSAPSSEIIVLSGGWVWVRITQSMSATSSASVYITYRDNNPSFSYTGSSAYGVYTWHQQLVAGATIDKPTPFTPGHEEDPTVIPAETIATGKQGGAYVWPVPGDADALYRVELDDASTTAAVNRVHIGAWQGRLSEGAPFALLDAVEGSSVSTGGLTQVGTWVPGISTDDTWRTIGVVDSTCNLPDGRYDVIARVRDAAQNISAPSLTSVATTGSIYARQVARVSHKLDPDHNSLTVPIAEPTQQGSTLVLFAQAIGPPAAWGSAQMTASITNGGGLTWTSLFTSGPAETLGKAQAWYVANAAPIGTQVTVHWSRDPNVNTVTVSLIEIVGAATSPLDTTDTDYQDSRTSADLESGVASATPTATGGLALSFGGGWNDWANPFTQPLIDYDQWYSVSSLTSGSIYARPIATLDPVEAKWHKVPVVGMFPDPIAEGWYVLLALFKAAASSGSSIGTGQWSVQVTAITADGVESLPSDRLVTQVVSSGSAVSVAWVAPENGTAAKYRVYRNRGTGWGYIDTADGTATSYTFTSESSVTLGSPPTQTSTVAALRIAVSPASGTTLAIGRSTSVRRANGIWEPVALGSITLPPVTPGESTMPDGWQVHVQARNVATYPVECNGLWLVSSDDGQVQAWRPRLNGAEPRQWIVDTPRDELTTAALMDGAVDAGQLVLVPGVLTLRSGGGAHISVRPDIADGVSDLVNADLRITRVLVTPRHHYLDGGDA